MAEPTPETPYGRIHVLVLRGEKLDEDDPRAHPVVPVHIPRSKP